MPDTAHPAATPGVADVTLNYPEELPVVGRRDDIMEAIRTHQVVVIAGETGSGKTTQLPKMCLELGRGATGQIGHTQPRRIAARSVAERIAAETATPLGELIGYQVRFADHSSDRTQVKVMTDGILLAELQRDPDLRRYDTLIIDEAHERSLNIDFILGYLSALLPRRPDLKLIITSATIDPDRFARHFQTDASGRVVREVPVIEVSGRTYPVEIRYRPLIERTDNGEFVRDVDQVTGVCEAVEELWTETPPSADAPDILVFFSGEREIRDAADALAAMKLPNTEVLTLFARLSAAEQHRVFTRGSGRRIILATNVAETSLTVPGVGYVIDTGTARISRYSQRLKVQRLPIEPISQASAQQRSGRCGRIANGVAIRLYSLEDFESRPEFTDPEITRTSLASVILQMTSLGLGDIARFPFIDAPDPRQISDGVALLHELHALREPTAPAASSRRRRQSARSKSGGLTAYGKTLARLPIDPRLGRMLIEAGRLGCTREVLIIVSALSIQDPRERPVDKEAEARAAHRRFVSETSDFASFHALWTYLRDQQKALSHSAFRRMCKSEYLHYLRVREWQDLHHQLKSACRAARIDPTLSTTVAGGEPDWDRVHQALLAGLLSHLGARDQRKREYAGARGSRFAINPGSGLFAKQPDFVMAAELVETTRLWARTNAAIDPTWAESAGEHLVKRTYSEPRWSKSSGSVIASEKVTLYGVPLVTDRTVQFARIDPAQARELFIRHALVEGDWETHHAFWKANTDLLTQLAEREERARRHDLVVDDEVLFAFFDARLPPEVASARHFDRWWKRTSRTEPDLLTFTPEMLTREGVGAAPAEAYPTTWHHSGHDLDVTYRFEPGAAGDGVSVHIPTAILNQIDERGFDWQVPGFREDLAVALVKSLPKARRRHFVPAPDHARAALAAIPSQAQAAGARFTDELAAALARATGVEIPAEEWDWSKVPDHLRVSFVVTGRGGRVAANGKDLEEVRLSAGGETRQTLSRAGSAIERAGLTTWPMDEVPTTFTSTVGGLDLQGYPALVDEGTTVAVRVLDEPEGAAAAHHAGVRRLLLLATTPPWKRVLAGLTSPQKIALARGPHGSVPALLEDALAAAVDAIVAEHVAGPVRTRADFEAAVGAVRTHAASRVLQIVAALEPILTLADDVTARLDRLERQSGAPAHLRATVADARAQRDSLIRPGFIADVGFDRLHHLERYLRAMVHRLDRAATNPREAMLQEQIDGIEAAYADMLDTLAPHERGAPRVRAIGWMIEELRVSLFAQALGTAQPVSEKRIRAAMRESTGDQRR